MSKNLKTILLGAVGSIVGTGVLYFINHWITQKWFSILETIFIFLFVSFFIWLLILTLRIKMGTIKQEGNEFAKFKKKFEKEYKPSILASSKEIAELDKKLRKLMQDLSEKYNEAMQFQNIDHNDKELMFILFTLANVYPKPMGWEDLCSHLSLRFKTGLIINIRADFNIKTNFLNRNGLIRIVPEENFYCITEKGLEFVRIARIKQKNSKKGDKC